MLAMESRRIARDLGDEVDQAAGGAFDDLGAAFGVGARGVAAGPRLLQVLRLPAKSDRAFRRQELVVARDFDRARHEIFRIFHVDEIAMEMQHHARLGFAAMDAEFALLRVKQVLRVRHAEP